jgi:hypothetical protein
MTIVPAGHSECGPRLLPVTASEKQADIRRKHIRAKVLLSAAALLFATLTLAQSQATPKITKVDPASGKVGDTVTISGELLGKDSVAAIFLSDDKSDFKAIVVSQAADKIVMKVPQVKPGGFNVSIQVGSGILIEPVRFTVEQ